MTEDKDLISLIHELTQEYNGNRFKLINYAMMWIKELELQGEKDENRQKLLAKALKDIITGEKTFKDIEEAIKNRILTIESQKKKSK